MSEKSSTVELNCQGLNCPLPILKTKKAIDGMQSGEVLKVTATDPGSVNDMPSWAKRTGNELMEHSEQGGIHTFYIRKK
jgi:tRNA 2-thiouridine synthesizing protein A